MLMGCDLTMSDAVGIPKPSPQARQPALALELYAGQRVLLPTGFPETRELEHLALGRGFLPGECFEQIKQEEWEIMKDPVHNKPRLLR